VFHRAFDLIEQPFDALDQLIDLGVKRILTAGMSPPTATHALGLPCGPYIPDSIDGRLLAMRRYNDRAAGRIEIIPCGGIRAANANRFIAETGAVQIHSACRSPDADHLDANQVRDLVTTVRAASGRKA
jgi:copper homeostasis protein